MTLSAVDRARAVRIEDEAAQRGVKLTGRVELIGPCPNCGGTDRFAINTAKQVFNCRGCQGRGDVISLVMLLDGCSFGEAVEELSGEKSGRLRFSDREIPQEQRTETAAEYERAQAEKAAWLWLKRQPIAGTAAETYLRKARSCSAIISRTLAFLPPSKPEHHPAMIAAFGLCDEPEPGVVREPRDVEAVHLTLLKPDGSGKADVKPNKLVIARPRARPIVLAPPNDLLGLAITEGIEDALSVHEATGLGAWAAGSAPLMPALADIVPGYVEIVHVLVDDDPTGRHHAGELTRRFRDRGFETVPHLLRSRKVVA